MTTTSEIYWDPFDTAIDSEPYGVWRALRDEAPLYRNDRYDFDALSRFADVEGAPGTRRRSSRGAARCSS